MNSQAATAPAGSALRDGARVGVVGGGPAGSFFSLFLLQLARRAGRRLDVTIYEPKDFGGPGARGCNMCGGIISESLLQNLAAEGIYLPPSVVQKRIDSYFLHMDVGSVRIETPLREKRIAAVYRGGGPSGSRDVALQSFDAYLLDQAVKLGARRIADRVVGAAIREGLPEVTTASGQAEAYDLLAVACGINSPAPKLFEQLGAGYRTPRGSQAYICEFRLGADMVRRYFGSSMHVFLLPIPRLEFAALIPKRDYVTLCLLGDDIDAELVHAFLDSPEVKRCMPPQWRAPDRYCQCMPKINVDPGVRAHGDRLLFLGDCGVTRLYKDGIGASYRVAKAAAVAAVFGGTSAEALGRRYEPACRRISRDNRLGRVVFAATRVLRSTRFARSAVWRMVSREQSRTDVKRRMSVVLWDTFTGSAPYRSILARSCHPAFITRLGIELVAALRRGDGSSRPKGVRMATGATGLLGRAYHDGEVVFHQGDRGDCMYVVLGGEVEVIRREGDREFCLAVLGTGDFFGEMALFADPVRQVTVRARGEVSVVTLERANLLQRIHEDPSLAFRIIERMSLRIRELETALIRQAAARAEAAE